MQPQHRAPDEQLFFVKELMRQQLLPSMIRDTYQQEKLAPRARRRPSHVHLPPRQRSLLCMKEAL